MFDDAPAQGTSRAEHLIRRGFDVVFAATVEEAEALWRPRCYIVVLVSVHKDVRRAVEFCDRIKEENPRQTVGMLVSPEIEMPPTRCPDMLWPEENLDCFLARVDTLADFAPAA